MKLPNLTSFTAIRPQSFDGRLVAVAMLLLTCSATSVADDESTSHDESVRKTTAVALNYCRAALHRIRRAPEKRTFYEEQTRILNNLDLNKIEDPEVISLYKSILDEISQVEISDRERVVIGEQFRRTVHRQLGTNFFVIGAQIATGQLAPAIQSGANSWWDYRNHEVRRDADQWKVEKSEFTNLMSRSSTFLDSFWRLSQKNNIPDRWLVRDQDLDQLASVLKEKDPHRQLRMLIRMERFMECYPPYWYYKARLQQHLGQSDDALETYHRLTEIGSGHFRQDDMLASSTANMALLQEQNGDPEAARTAARVLDYSTRNWESNLICAWVLGRHRQFEGAEDLILCNLDEEQEAEQSRIALVSLYYHSEDKTKLAALLSDPNIVRDVPIPGLLLSARLLGADGIPRVAQGHLAATMSASVRRTASGESVVLAATPGWKLQDASAKVASGNKAFHSVGYRPVRNGINAEFARADSGGLDSRVIRVVLNYPDTPPIHITLNRGEEPSRDMRQPAQQRGFPRSLGSLHQAMRPMVPNSQFEIAEIELEGVRLSFHDDVINNDARANDSDRDVKSGDSVIRS